MPINDPPDVSVPLEQLLFCVRPGEGERLAKESMMRIVTNLPCAENSSEIRARPLAVRALSAIGIYRQPTLQHLANFFTLIDGPFGYDSAKVLREQYAV